MLHRVLIVCFPTFERAKRSSLELPLPATYFMCITNTSVHAGTDLSPPGPISYVVNLIFKTSSKPYTKVQSIFKTGISEIYLISYIVNPIFKTYSKPYTKVQSIFKTGLSEIYLNSPSHCAEPWKTLSRDEVRAEYSSTSQEPYEDYIKPLLKRYADDVALAWQK